MTREPPALYNWLYARQRFGINPGLARTRRLLERLGEPQEAFTTVLVGGTNGKGSTAATLASILHASGRGTALFTSPHLSHFRERFVVGDLPLDDGSILAALAELKPVAEEVEATFFEVVTALACLLFARAGVEVAVMEVGLGGRFDATNALEPELSLITSVALDHTAILGNSVEQIAFEKAGIMRSGRLCLTGAQGEALEVLEGEARAREARLWRLGHEIAVDITSRGWRGLSCLVRSPLGAQEVETPLLGLHQGGNVALAVAAAQEFGLPEAAILEGALRTRWPGRLEPLRYGGRRFLLDGAHNPQAAAALAAALRELGVRGAPLIFGCSDDKDLLGIRRALEPAASQAISQVIFTRARLSPRALEPERLLELWPGGVVAAPPQEAVAAALELSREGETVVVAGSLYLVGELRPYLLSDGLGEAGGLGEGLGERDEVLERWQ